MDNNNIFCRLRYILNINEDHIINIFNACECKISYPEINSWLKKDDHLLFKKISDKQLATFLNGLIIRMRGKKEGPIPEAENKLNNNIVMKKLKIAFDLQAESVIEIIGSAGLDISKHVLSSFFRKKDHKNYRPCQDQILRKFLSGLQNKYRPKEKKKKE